MIDPRLILLIYAFVFISIYDLKCKNYQYFGKSSPLKHKAVCSRQHFEVLLFFIFYLHFMWIVCLADNSREMSSLIFSENN